MSRKLVAYSDSSSSESSESSDSDDDSHLPLKKRRILFEENENA